MNEIWEIAGAIIASLGGGALIIGAFSTWLGKVWAARILESDRAKYQTEIELIKSDLNKKIHEHNVAVSRIDAHRAEAIQQLYVSLVRCSEAAFDIMAPNNKLDDFSVAIPTYKEWAKKFRQESEQLEKLGMLYAISMGEDTYKILSKCGQVISHLSIEFCDAVFNADNQADPDEILARIETAKQKLIDNFDKDFQPAKAMLIKEFRAIMDPRLKEIDS
jgi:hypothetical protein